MSATPHPKRVVVCADDFGLNVAASEAIIVLARMGAISAASCVVDADACARYAGELCGEISQVSLGLHFDLTTAANGKPSGSLRGWILRTCILRSADSARIATAVNRQFDRFEALFRRAPAFVDGHEHVHQFPVIRDVLLNSITKRYGTALAIRTTVPLESRGVKAATIAQLGGRALRRTAGEMGVYTNSDFGGVYGFDTTVAYRDRMRGWLRSIADGGLIMCHPEISETGRSAREEEYRLLASAEWRSLLDECGVRLVPFAGRAQEPGAARSRSVSS